jgi:hypothetical protein
MLGKTMLEGYYMKNEKTFAKELDEFYDKHNYCCETPIPLKEREWIEPKFEPKEVDTENQYEIAYEHFRG